MNKQLKRDIVWLLKRSKQVLWDGNPENAAEYHQYICHAITDSVMSRYFIRTIEAGDYLENEINNRLGYDNYGSQRDMETWLRYKCKINKKDLTDVNIQAHRLAWINLLIKEFSE